MSAEEIKGVLAKAPVTASAPTENPATEIERTRAAGAGLGGQPEKSKPIAALGDAVGRVNKRR